MARCTKQLLLDVVHSLQATGNSICSPSLLDRKTNRK